jgi:hypothetical protein
MPVMTWQLRQRPSQPLVYAIVLARGNGADPRPQAFATDANQATVVFHKVLPVIAAGSARRSCRFLRDHLVRAHPQWHVGRRRKALRPVSRSDLLGCQWRKAIAPRGRAR